MSTSNTLRAAAAVVVLVVAALAVPMVSGCRSPEDGRPRGGGHGGDGGNYRTGEIHVPSKIDGTKTWTARPEDLTGETQGRRPRDLALLLLAIGTGPPRARARDQQADLAGGDLRRRILDRLAALDPEPESLEPALAGIVSEFGEPTGPTRGVCSQVLQEWRETRISPSAWGWLLSEAIGGADRGDEPRRQRRSRGAP